MNKFLHIFILALILILASYLRFYNLESIPAGLHADAASQGYNAFSLLENGKDRYGESWPILFRAFGYYQPPLYTYLSMIPVAMFGNSQFSIHFISALSGLILTAVTYLFVLALFKQNQEKYILALTAALIITITPWSVFFSRLAVEANLGLLIFVTSLLLFIYSLRKIQILPIAGLILGISTHAYYSERLIAVIFLPLFLFLFRKKFLPQKKWLILTLLMFAITQIPHLMILRSGALTQRFNQVNSFDNTLGGFTQILSISKMMLNNFLIYYSPTNLFYDSDINLGRTMPGLSIFYNWQLIPFLIGIWWLIKNRSLKFAKIIGVLMIITPLPAAFTGDFFYPLRTLNFLWVLSIVIVLGLLQMYVLIKLNLIKLLIFSSFLIYSLFSLYVSYFILFKYEKAESYGYSYIKLMNKLAEYNDKQIIIDSARDPGIGIRIAYLNNFSPKNIQTMLRPQMKTPYYNGLINTDEVYKINNLEVKPLSFGDACRNNVILVGDRLAVSPKQTEDHELKLEFSIIGLSGKDILYGYSTSPKKQCLDN